MGIKIFETAIKDVKIIQPNVFQDDRGYFSEIYNKKDYYAAGITANFVQDNQSLSSFGTIRGMHFQTGKYTQAKLVRAAFGEVLDVVVDLRPYSSTFGKHVSVELSSYEQNMLLVPRGFAHGFVTLSEIAIFAYKCDNFYNKQSEGGILYNDPELNINWRVPECKMNTSDKDKLWPTLEQLALGQKFPLSSRGFTKHFANIMSREK